MEPLERTSRRIAALSIGVSAALAILKITSGLKGNSTAVVSDGIESASDVLTSGMVLIGLTIASRPPDADHPYGHGRFETLSALFVGSILSASGSLICFHSWQRAFQEEHAPALFTIWPLLISIVVKSVLYFSKRGYGKRLGSEALMADASNDAMDVVSAIVALAGLSITLLDPRRFSVFDHIGGFGVGLVVIALGIRVVRDTVLQLTDTMPGTEMLAEIRAAALHVPGALNIEKCYARKTGFRYHVDLHLEVDPRLTVAASHEIAGEVRTRVRRDVSWVADVLVHVEPFPLDRISPGNGK